jgi:ribonuclease-3
LAALPLRPRAEPLEVAGDGGPRQMIIPRSGHGRLPGEQNPAYVLLSPLFAHPRPRFFAMQARRLRQLEDFLAALGLADLCAADPGSGAAEAPGPGQRAARLAPIEEALTHSSAGRPRNHEQLEFLGDAVLRLAASQFLRHRHPDLSVGRWSALRAQLVSDRWLAQLAQHCDLAPMLHLGPMARADASGRATVLAECAEALIGALYLVGGAEQGGLEAVGRWLDPHWRREIALLLADPHRHNWKSALQEWSQGKGLGLPRYASEEHSRQHGDPRRFHCGVSVGGRRLGEGWGGSRREAEQQAARAALALLEQGEGEPAPALSPPPGS